MMNILKKLIAAAAAFALLISVCSCGSGNAGIGDDTGIGEDTAPADTAPSDTAAASDRLTIADGDALFTVIRGDNADKTTVDAAVKLRGELSELCGVEFDIGSDWVSDNGAPGEYELLVGETERPASAAASEGLGANEYRVVVSGGVIVLAGGTSACLNAAAAHFMEIIKNEGDGKMSVPGEYDYTGERGVTVAEYVNPVAPSGADPWVTAHDGRYFYCYSAGNGVNVAEIANVGEISSANGKKVYTAPAGTMYSKEYWAPELHYLAGEWYIYVAADDGDNFNHRMYVLKGTSQDPTEPFEFVGKIEADADRWAIDGTVLEYKDELYFVWSGWEGTQNVAQNLYIAHMSDPSTIDSPRVCISKPELAWETIGDPLINEGPAALVRGDTAHIVYSASGSWTNDYCLGILTCRGGDPLLPESWTKGEKPLMSKGRESYGPGHCSFVDAPDGSVTYVVYHANMVPDTGWSGRSVRVQPITWDGDMPVTGKPLKPGETFEVVVWE